MPIFTFKNQKKTPFLFFQGLKLLNKIKTKIVLIVLFITAVSFTFFAYLAFENRIPERFMLLERQNQLKTDKMANLIDDYCLDHFKRIMIQLSQDQINQNWSQSFKPMASSIFQIWPSLLGVAVYDEQNQLIAATNFTPNPSVPHYISTGFYPIPELNWQGIVVSLGKAAFFPEFNQFAVTFELHLPPPESQKSTATLVFFLGFQEWIANFFQPLASSGMDFCIADSNGMLFLHPRIPAGTRVQEYSIQEYKLELKQHLENLGVPPSPNNPPVNDQGEPIIRTRSFCPILKWSVFIEKNLTSAKQGIRYDYLWLLFIFMTVSGILLVISISYIHNLLQPLENLEEGIKLFETGLLAEALPIHSQDEIGRLTQTFNQMVKTLVTRNEEIQRKNRRLLFFNEITGIINQTIDLNTLLDQGLKKILQLVHVPAGWIHIYDPQLKKLTLLTHLGIPAEWVKLLEDYQLGNTFMQKVLTTEKPVLIRDFARHLETANSLKTDALFDLFLIPLRSKKRIVGIMALASNRKYFLQYRNLDQLTRIGDELGIAVENALLYIELQMKIKERDEVNRDLQEMDRFKNRILSNVSHELRTPITTIKTYVELFLQDRIGPLQPDQKEKLQIVNRNIKHLLALIEDLLTFGHLQDQKLLLKNQEVIILQELIEQVIIDTGELARVKGLTLKRIGLEQPVRVRVNYQKMRQVFQNLVSNAIKFTENGSILIETRLIQPAEPNPLASPPPASPISRVEISVTDTGIGIPKKSFGKIFQRFYQVDSSSTRKYVGTGLGLAIVKEILEAHGSEIQVESRLDEGSRFYFSLPIEDLISFGTFNQ